MKALLINNKEIVLDGVTYVACPELEEFQEYTVVSEIEIPGRAPVYEIEESERWLLTMRFVPMDGSGGAGKERWKHFIKQVNEKRIAVPAPSYPITELTEFINSK